MRDVVGDGALAVAAGADQHGVASLAHELQTEQRCDRGAVAGGADQELANGAIEQTRSGFHRRSWPMSLGPPTG